MAPAGMAENNGLAHLYLAVHRTEGAGQLRATIPLTGAYALDGRQLLPTDTFNAYAGETFVSTNHAASPTAPTGESGGVTPTPDETNGGDDLDAERVRPTSQYLYPGWNAVGWTDGTALEALMAQIGEGVDVIMSYDAALQDFRRHAPDAPAIVSTLPALQPATGLLVHVTAEEGVRWTLPPLGEPRATPLAEGFNFVTWTGAGTSIEEATVALAETLIGGYALDAPTQRYRSYRPDGPRLLNDLTRLEIRQAVWVQVQRATVWESRPASSPIPDGVQARVLGPGCLHLRPAPTTVDAPPLACLRVGTPVEPTGETARDTIGREWLHVRVGGAVGWVSADFIAVFPGGDTVDGEATFYHPTLHGDPMFCGGTYDRRDPAIAAATSWPCGTRLRVWRGDRFVDVVVRDGGLLPPNDVDLSEAAFEQIGDLTEGRFSVRIEVLSGSGGR